MVTIRSLALMAIAMLLTSTAGSAFAIPFTPVLDEFWIIKNGVEIFRDGFGNGILPPDGPDGSSTYSSVAGAGLGGMTSEAGGKLTMTPALGAPTLITGVFADTFTSGLRRNTTNSSGPDSLLLGDSFEVHGLYDLSNLPANSGQSFGIGVTDRFTPSNAGNDELRVFVVRNVTGDLGVAFRELSFIDDTNQVVAFESIESFLPFSAGSQIELMLSKAADTDEVLASWRFGTSSTFNQMDNINNDTAQPVTIYNGEAYTRARFQSTDTNVPIPVPSTYALMLAGLGVLTFVARRKGHNPR